MGEECELEGRFGECDWGREGRERGRVRGGSERERVIGEKGREKGW